MRKAFVQLLSPPHFDDDEKNRVAKFLHIVILTIIGIVLASAAITGARGNYPSLAALGALLASMVVAYLANRTRRTAVASYITLFGAVAGITLVLAVGQGIHDIGVINYGLILIVASYLLRNKGIILITLSLIISTAVLVFGEFYGWLPVQNTPEKFAPEISDFVIIALFLILGAVAIHLLSQTLQDSFKQSKTAELRWRSLVNSIPDVVAIIDKQGTIRWLNRATSQASAFYIGKSVFEVMAASDGNFSKIDLEDVLRGNTLTSEARLLTSGGEIRWYSISMGPIHQPDDSISGAIAVVRDIQENKDAEAELRRNQESLRVQTRQLETLQEISRGISTLKDLPGTLRLVLAQMQATLPLDSFVVALYDQETNMVSFPLVFDEGETYQEDAMPLYPQDVIAEAIFTRKTHTLNRSPEQIQNPSSPAQKRLGTKKVSASILTAPMIVHDRVIGTLSAHSYSCNTYNDEHATILSGAANQVAIVIENARLYESSRAKAEQLAALNEIGRSISTLRELNVILESVYPLLQRVLQLDAFYIALYNPEDQTISYPIVIDDGKKWSEKSFRLTPDRPVTKTILTGEPYLINRSREEIAWRQANLDSQNMLGETSKVSASLMIAPLQFAGKVLGVISTQSYKLDAYASDDLDLLMGVGTQVAIAIENARLYAALQKELAERKRTEAEVRDLNTDLEAHVRQRTAELEAANKELASFTYTVSHDLRAPIRGINGLTHIIIEDFEQELPAGVIAHIGRIQASARQMGQLIDELLAFTHLGRQPIRRTMIDMEALCRFVIKESMSKETREISFTVHQIPPAYGDLTLIRQALTNLVDNAIKFTVGKTSPQVEIGCLERGEEAAYYIRDNGVGFDMAYAGKLFGVFERLHRQDEFEGIGVGLAIVKRIINKHGGRVWTEAKVNEGATFFFTLPNKKTKGNISMPTPLSPSSQKVQESLRALGYSFVVVESPIPTKTAGQAAQFAGCQLGQIVKSLIFRGTESGKPILVLTSGANRVDESRISGYAGEPIGRADPEFVRAVTGFAIGGVPPVGHLQQVETYLDQDLMQYETIWAAAGTPNSLFALTPIALQEMTQARIAVVRQEQGE